jgi:23S rRNA pseudouridine2457 synthase
MTAAVGHPTLRLVRVKIGNWTLEGIAPGEYKATTINLPKSAMADAPRGRNSRPAERQERKTAEGDRTNTANAQKQLARNNANPNGDKSRTRPSGRKPNTSKATAPKPSVATKVIIKPSRSKPTEQQ